MTAYTDIMNLIANFSKIELNSPSRPAGVIRPIGVEVTVSSAIETEMNRGSYAQNGRPMKNRFVILLTIGSIVVKRGYSTQSLTKESASQAQDSAQHE